MSPMSRSPQLAARRVGQTLRAFENGPALLWGLATSRTPWAADGLTFQSRDGATIRCPNVPGARVPVYELFAEDAYRFDDLLAGLPEHPVVLDVGAQVGCFTVSLARRLPRARVHAYEASPTTATWLRRNVSGNGLDDRVTVHQTALAGHSGTLTFADNGSASGQNGLSSPTPSGEIEVPCVTLADAVREAGGTVDLVKMDIEGGEHVVVLSSPPEAWHGVRRLVMEYHRVPGRSWAALEEFLTGVGFVLDHHETVEDGFGAVWLSRPSA